MTPHAEQHRTGRIGWLRATVLGLTTAVAAALVFGKARWRCATETLHARLEAARLPVEPVTYDAEELDGLPAPVQRYFRAVLRDGQPMVSAVRIGLVGTINMSAAAEQWRPFTSTQRVITRRPGFDWDARIAMAPGLTARVHDAYVAGEGLLHASLFGLVSVADERGTPEMARGELLRYFAEAAWYPTALLPSQGVRWEAVDDASARATLSDGETAVTLLFRFGADGLIESAHADARGRAVAGVVTLAPWEGRWEGYAVRGGMRVPLRGEVAWILPEGRKPYFRGRITRIAYESAR
jgi:hypothetical protein